MSAILSLLCKDLRLLRRPWFGYLAVLLARIVLGAWCVLATRFTSADNTLARDLDLLLTISGLVLAYLLTLRLVQADALLRARAFWRTRPVSGAQLLAAKSLAAALLFVLPPLLVALPWWLVNGFNAPEIAWAASDILLAQAAMLGTAFLVASLVDSFSRAILWSIVLFGLIFCLNLATDPLVNHYLDKDLAFSRQIVVVVVVAITLPALIVWQFLRRATVAVIVGAVFLQAAAIGIATSWPHDFKPRQAAWTELRPAFSKTITLQPARTEYSGPRRTKYGQTQGNLRLTWPVTGLPPGLIATTRLESLVLTNGDAAPTVPEKASAYSGPELHHKRIRNLLGLAPFKPILPPDVPNYWADWDESTPFIGINCPMTPEQADRIRLQPPAATASLRLRIYHPELSQSHPLTPGLWFADQNGGVRIARVEPTETGVHVERVTTQPASFLRSKHNAWFADASGPPPDDRLPTHDDRLPTHDDFLIQAKAGGNEWPHGFGHRGPELSILGVSVRHHEFDHSPRKIRRDDKWVVPPDIDLTAWRAGLRLARIAYHEEARLLITAHTDALVLEDAPAPSPK